MRITRSLAIPALALSLLAGGNVISAVSNLTENPSPAPVHLASAGVCEEDQNCWDCEVMGNQICGLPDIQANDTRRAIAWQTWDRAEGWRLMRVDPSVPVRIDVIGYSPVKPRGEFSLRATDGYWYVFAAV